MVVDEEGKAKVKEGEGLREKMRERRNEREQVLRKVVSEDVYNMYADSLKYETV